MKLQPTRMPSIVLLAGILAACAAGPAYVQPAVEPPTGRWVTASGNFEVEIAPCGQALCGTVVRVLANRSMSNAKVEAVPADSRPALGMKILSDFTASGDGEWKGQIYNRENGKTYSCLMSLAAPDELKVRPYVGLSLFGQTQIWRRAGEAGPK